MPPPPGARRTRILWIVVALALLLVGARAGLPALIAHLAREQGTQALGVPVAIGDVDLWLLLGGVALEDVRIDSPGGSDRPPLLTADHLYAEIAWLPLLSGEIRLREITSDGLQLSAERDATGTPVLPPGLAADAEEQAAPVAEDAAEGGETDAGWPLAIERLALRQTVLLWSALEAPEEPPLVDFRIGELKLGDVGYRDGQLALGQFGLSEPRLRIHPALTRVPAAGETPPPAVEPAPPETATPEAEPAGAETGESEAFPFRLAQLSIDGASFTVLTPKQEITIQLDLDARNITTAEAEPFPLRLDLSTSEGGRLQLEGELGLRPVRWKGRLEWESLRLPDLAGLALAPEPGPLDWIRAGETSGDLTLAFDLDAKATELARISGRLGVQGLDLRDEPETFAVALEQLAVEIEQLALPSDLEHEAPRISLASVEIVAPQVRYALEPAQEAPAAPTSEPAEPGGPEPQVAIARLRISQGRVALDDRTLSPPLTSELRRLEVAADGLSWPARDVERLRVRAVSSQRGAFTLEGAVAGGSGELHAVLDDLGLAPFTPYASHYVGYGIDRGSATLRSDVVLRKGEVSSENELMLRELRMTAQGQGVIPDPLGVPIDVALALLRDARDEIHLDVPVHVSEGGTRSGVGSALTSAIKQAILGALSTPLQLAGSVPLPIRVPGLGRGVEPAEAFRFAAGSAEADADSGELAQELAKLLAGRPALAVTLHGATDDADAAILTRRRLLELIESGDAPELPDSGFLQRRRLRQGLERQLAGEPDELERDDRRALERWIALVDLPSEGLAALARERSEAVRALLDAGGELSSDRISLGSLERGHRGVLVSLGPYPPSDAS